MVGTMLCDLYTRAVLGLISCIEGNIAEGEAIYLQYPHIELLVQWISCFKNDMDSLI